MLCRLTACSNRTSGSSSPVWTARRWHAAESDSTTDYAELKRMYSKPSIRGRGVAKRLLARLEMEARDAGQASVCIETGLYQREAMRLYEGAGYCRCEAFGPYGAMPPKAIETSVFYEKRLPNLSGITGGRVDR